MKAYTGIGSRSTPAPILELFRAVARALAEDGWVLRSGCAQGADSAFERGAWEVHETYPSRAPEPELYLPWPGFENRERHNVTRTEPQSEAFPIAAQFHPAWDRLSQGARRLHARNVHQILGPDVTAPLPSRFVVCWTPHGTGRGGTGQALRMAQHFDIEILDVGAGGRPLERIEDFLTARG